MPQSPLLPVALPWLLHWVSTSSSKSAWVCEVWSGMCQEGTKTWCCYDKAPEAR